MTHSVGARRPLVMLLIAATAMVGFLSIAAERSDAAAFNRCPGYFEVKNNDKIGGVSFPKGDYYFAVNKYGGKQTMSCDPQASNWIKKFLNAGRPTTGWTMRVLGPNRPDVIFQTTSSSSKIKKIKMKRITS